MNVIDHSEDFTVYWNTSVVWGQWSGMTSFGTRVTWLLCTHGLQRIRRKQERVRRFSNPGKGWLGRGAVSGRGGKWLVSGSILKVEPVGFADSLEVEWKSEREVKIDFRVFGLNNWKDRIAHC